MSLKRDRYFGETEQQVITGWVEELARDATSLWHIITAGREGFELEGPELIDFVRRSLMALFAAGAKPVQGKIDPDYLWGRVTKYGDDPQQMTDAIIDEWQKSGRDPDAGGIWFATPNVFGGTAQRIAGLKIRHGSDPDFNRTGAWLTCVARSCRQRGCAP